MDRLQRATILARLMRRLREKGSWCGETHVQKATYLLERLMNVPLGLRFILYKHGPYSFDLRNDLTGLQADGMVRVEPQSPYGVRIEPTERSAHFEDLYRKVVEKYSDATEFIATALAHKGVSDLERLATAFYVTDQMERGKAGDERAARLAALKPHISLDEAKNAIVEVDRIIGEANKVAA